VKEKHRRKKEEKKEEKKEKRKEKKEKVKRRRNVDMKKKIQKISNYFTESGYLQTHYVVPSMDASNEQQDLGRVSSLARTQTHTYLTPYRHRHMHTTHTHMVTHMHTWTSLHIFNTPTYNTSAHRHDK